MQPALKYRTEPSPSSEISKDERLAWETRVGKMNGFS
jgi:hypothetical protein